MPTKLPATPERQCRLAHLIAHLMYWSHGEVPMSSSPFLSDPSLDDAELARRIGCDDEAAFESLMRRNNGRLFRVARAILKDAADAEDVLQEAYLTAYRHIADFRADAKLTTWLTRIVINKALALRRKRHRDRIVVHLNEMRPDAPRGAAYAVPEESAESPEQSTTRTDMRRLLERSEEHTSELQSQSNLVCRLLLEKKNH